jgi:hypothetical protein
MKIGITGHQTIGDSQTVAWVRHTLERLLLEYSASRGFTCLAMGADQLFADLLTNHRIPFTAVIPCAGYENVFDTEKARDEYIRYLQLADDVIRLQFSYPSEEAFYEGGKEVVKCSDVLFAIWNGKPAGGLGGTADIVQFAKKVNKVVVHINPINLKINTFERRGVRNGKTRVY